MPPRFSEVVDVGAEASLTVAALLARGQGYVGQLSFNISDYITNTTSGAFASALERYNLTLDAIPSDWGEALREAGLNLTAPEEYVPEGTALTYLLTALALFVSRELYVRWRVGRMLRKYGMHAH